MTSKKPKWILDNTIKSTKGTSKVFYSTEAYSKGAGHKKVVHKKR